MIRAIGNTHLWLFTFHILALSPTFFFSYFLFSSCWSRMTQQLTSMPGHYLKPKGIWASLEPHEMQQGRETGWGKYNLGFVPLLFFSHCPCNFFFLLFLASSTRLCEKTYFTNNMNVRNCEKGAWQSVAEVHIGMCSWGERGTNC